MLRIADQTCPRGVASVEVAASTGVIWVTSKEASLGSEGRRCGGSGLEGGCFGGQRQAGDVTGAVDVVLVEDGVLGGDGVEPCCFLALGPDAAGGIKSDGLALVIGFSGGEDDALEIAGS